MSDEQVKEQEQQDPKEALKQVSEQLKSLSATRAACITMINNQKIKIVDETDETEEPLSISLNGQAVSGLLSPLLQAVNANREQLINQKEYLLNQIEGE